MRITKLLAFFVSLSLLSAHLATGQSTTGFQPFGTFTNAGIESINMGDLNAHWAIPVISRSGRIPFSFAATYDSTAYYLAGNNPYTYQFQPISGFGWGQSLQSVFGALNYAAVLRTCLDHNHNEWDWDDYTFVAYIDGAGTSHPLHLVVSDAIDEGVPCNTTDHNPSSGTAVTSDGSAYMLNVSITSQALVATVTSRDGDVIVPVSAQGNQDFGMPQWVDRNGNMITTTITYPSGNEVTTFTDTLGSTVLTDTWYYSSSQQHTYTYTKPGGGTASVTFNYGTYTVQTNFGCSNAADFGPTAEYLVSSVQLPDGGQYVFNYEPTPGHPGNYTGRIASITLPSGGTVSYQYTGANNGLNCSDGTILGYNRTTQDGAISYSRSGGVTTVSDQQGKSTQYSFNSQYYETQRQYLSGSTVLQTINTTYNGGGTFFLPITRLTKNTVLPNGLQNENDITYNSNSLPTNENDYDWGNGAPGALVRQTATSYASLSSYILDKPYQTTVYDGGSNTKSQTTYSYDQTGVTSSGASQLQSMSGSRGNATTIASWVQGSTTIQRTFAYFDTGLPKTSTDFNNNPTSYSYGNCNASFPTTISLPGGLTQSMAWDCNGGVMTSSTDFNNHSTTYTYGDPNYWRLTQVSDSLGGQVTTSYNTSSTPWNTVQTSKITPTQSVSTNTVLDGLGRLQQNQLTSDPDGTVYVVTAYDIDGNVHSTSNPYRNTSDPTYGVTYFAYDVLGRVTQQTQPDNNVITASPSNNCTTVTDEAGKKRELCSDGLGRVTVVYEPDSSNNLTIETDYQYDPLGNLTQVTQKGGSGDSSQWRIRSYVYDGLSRVTQATTPEAGTVNYFYTSGGSLCSGDPTLPCSRTDARTITTTYSYDSLNRLTGKTYNDGSTPSVAYYYDQTSYNGITIGNGKGRRTGMSDGTGQTAWSYDADGRVLLKQQTINGVTNSMSHSYNLDGSVATLTSPGGHTYNYGYDNAGRPVSLADNAIGATYVQNAHYNAPGELTSAQHGLNLAITETNNFNNRLEPLSFSASASSETVLSLSYNWVLPGSVNNGSVYQIQNNRDNTRSAQYGYDQLNRLISAQTYNAATWGNTYVYDNWGNLLQKNPISGYPGENLTVTADAHNQLHPTSGSFTYDASGNMTWDTFNAMSFNAENQETPESSSTYYYDGDGHRVENVQEGDAQYYWYDDNDNVITSTGSVGQDYIYFNGQKVAFLGLASGNQHYYWTDHLGSASVMSNSDGSAIEWESDYYPFGTQRPINQYLNNYYMFAGWEWDSGTGYYNAHFRLQSPNLGRFLSPDPLEGDISNPQSFNRYSYVLNNPINLTDPLGLQAGGGSGCGGDIGIRCGSPAAIGGCPSGFGASVIPCAAANPGGDCGLSIDGGGSAPCSLIFGGQSVSLAQLAQIPVTISTPGWIPWDNSVAAPTLGGSSNGITGHAYWGCCVTTQIGLGMDLSLEIGASPFQVASGGGIATNGRPKMPSRTSNFVNCVKQTVSATLSQTAGEFGSNLKKSVEVGVPLGLSIGAGILASEPEFLPVAPAVLAVATGETVSTFVSISTNIFIVRAATDLVAGPAFCAVNTF